MHRQSAQGEARRGHRGRRRPQAPHGLRLPRPHPLVPGGRAAEQCVRRQEPALLLPSPRGLLLICSAAMAAEELTAFLAKTSFFGGLTPEVVGAVAGMLKEKRVSAGELLFAEGDTGKSM